MRLALRLALLLPLLAPSLLAQERTLAWPEISVTAHLDADGRLHVRERQVMLFNGDWNGGERTFPRVLGQSLAFERLRRIDPATGEARELAAGDLDAVDEYEASNGGHTIRWRSRLPDDPPFANTQLVYELEFTYGGVVEPTSDGGYDLDHNFLFEDRSGYVARFELVLTVDPAWRTPPDFTGRWTAEAIPPGEGFHVDLVLQRAAGSRPAAVRAGTPMVVRQGLVAALVAGIILLFLRLVARERRIGRWAPLPPASLVTREYLQEHVFSQLPEVVGAAWDDHTAEPEVAATLARLVQEKKLSSSVKTQKVLMFSSHQLHLKLEVPRDRFRDHERALIDALFTPGDDTTDTGRVRERYRKTGFDPASLIRPHVESYVEVTTPGGKGEKPSRKPTLALAALALALVVAGSVRDPAGVGIAALALGLSLPVYLVSMGMAAAWQRMLTGLAAKTLLFLVPLLAGAGVFATLALVQGRWRLDPLVLAGLVVWVLAIANSVFNVARSRQSPERIARRRQLAVARAFFETELEKEAPSLSDDWFPWIVAFGLGPHVDRWFKSFGGETRRTTAIVSSGGVSSGSSSRGGQQWTGFGGGGGFSGGGGGASFGAAIGGMAASVPKPSSGSSSGGGGGGSRSGGGGGGGW